MYSIQDVPGKGKGMVATKKILKGTRIASEIPVIRFANVLQIDKSTPELKEIFRMKVEALTPEQQKSFYSLHSMYKDNLNTPHLGIIRTNRLPVGDDEGGIFLDVCRINHSCANNAQRGWNVNIEQSTVHAMRDIEEGEEITCYYLKALDCWKERQEILQRKFAFTCNCSLCSLPLSQREECDQRVTKIHELEKRFSKASLHGILVNPLRSLRWNDERVALYNEHGRDGPDDNGLPRGYYDAAQIVVAHGDLARCIMFAERAYRCKVVSAGHDDGWTRRYKQFTQMPAKHDLFQYARSSTMEWKTLVDDVPKGLGPKEFDDWLWMRGTPSPLEEATNLRDRRLFPSFQEIPHEDIFHTDFYSPPNRGPPFRIRRNWMLLAEIVSFNAQSYIKIVLQDIDGTRLPFGFDSSIAFREGHTIALPYARRCNITLDGWGMGVRYNRTKDLKV